MTIKQMRKRAGLTQEQAARALGVTVTTFARWERDEKGSGRIPKDSSREMWLELVRSKKDKSINLPHTFKNAPDRSGDRG
jgi:transcriptional regulator with XRE-family HTH domain